MNTIQKMFLSGQRIKKFFVVFVLTIFVAESLIVDITVAQANFDELKQALVDESVIEKTDEIKEKDVVNDVEDVSPTNEEERRDLVDEEKEVKVVEEVREDIVDREDIIDYAEPNIKRIYPSTFTALIESEIYITLENYTLKRQGTFFNDVLALLALDGFSSDMPEVVIGRVSARGVQIIDENTIIATIPALEAGTYNVEVRDGNTTLKQRDAIVYQGIVASEEVDDVVEEALDDSSKEVGLPLASTLTVSSHSNYSNTNHLGFGTTANQVELIGFNLTVGPNPVSVDTIYFNTASSGVINGDLRTIQLMHDENRDGTISTTETTQFGGNAIPSLDNNTIYISNGFTLTSGTTYSLILRADLTNLANQDSLSLGLTANSQYISAVSGGQPATILGSNIALIKHTSLGTPILNVNGINGNNLAFGNFPYDSSSLTFAAKTIALKNQGDATLNIGHIDLSGTDFFAENFVPFDLSPNETKNIVLGFNPATSTAGTISSSLSIYGNSALASAKYAANLSGSSQNSTDLVSSLVASPIEHNFGKFLSDSSDATYSNQSLVLRNTGTADITINNITTPAGAFSLKDNLNGVIKPFESKETQIKFNPTQTGLLNAVFTVNFSGTNGSQNIAITLNGEGVSEYQNSEIQIEPSFLNFGKRQIGFQYRKEVKVTNTGTSSLDLTSLSNPGQAFGFLNTNLPTTLAPGAFINLTATYNPVAAVVSRGNSILQNSDPNELNSMISFVGEGQADVAPVVESIKTRDEDENGKLDAIEVNFSEAMDTAKNSTVGFTVQNYVIAPTGIYENNKTFKLVLTENSTGTAGTPLVTYSKATGVIQDSTGKKLEDFVLVSQDNAKPVISSAVIFDDGKDHLRETGIDSDDYVEITFSEDTNKFNIASAAINSILQPRKGTQVHNWGTVTTSWSSASKLFVYLSGDGTATVADSDSIYVQPTRQIMDLVGNYASGVKQMTGSFSPSATPIINTITFSAGVVPNGASTTIVSANITDTDGMGNISSVILDLSPIGVNSPIYLANSAPSYLASTGVFTNSGVYANPGIKAGVVALTMEVTDDQGLKSTKQANITILNSTPTVLSAIYNPTQGVPGQSQINLSVVVRDLNTISDITSVSANMSQFGGFSTATALSLITSPSSTNGTYILSGGFTIPSSTPAGSYVFPITVTDSAGSSQASTVGEFIVLNVTPQILTANITPQSINPGSKTTAKVTVSDANGINDISSVSLDFSSIVNSSGTSMDPIISLTNLNGVYTNDNINVPLGTPAGTYLLPLTAKDKAGNTATTYSIRLQVNDVPATITTAVFTPASGAPGSTTSIRAIINEPNGRSDIASVRIDLAPFGVGIRNLALAPSTTDTYELHDILVPSPKGLGSYSFVVKVLGENGNSDTKTPIFTVTNKAPEVVSATYTPASGLPGTSGYNLSVSVKDFNTVRDIASVKVNMGAFSSALQNVNLALVSDSTAMVGTYMLSGGFGIPLLQGARSYTFPITVVDASGTGVTSLIGEFNVLNIAPQITALSITPQAKNPGDNTTVQATILDGNGVSDISAVSLDFSTVVNASGVSMVTTIPLYDNGTKGDITANDGTYTNNAVSAPVGTPAGTYTLPVKAIDKAGAIALSNSIRLQILNTPIGISEVSFTPNSGLPGSSTTIRAIINEPNGNTEVQAVTIDLKPFGINQVRQMMPAPSMTGVYELSNIYVPTPKGQGALSFVVKALGTDGSSDIKNPIFTVSNSAPSFASIYINQPNLTPETTQAQIFIRINDLNGSDDISATTMFADLSSIGGLSQVSFSQVVGAPNSSLYKDFGISGVKATSGVSAGTKTINFTVKDNNGGQGASSAVVVVVNAPTVLSGAVFAPQNILANGNDPTKLTVKVTDLNGTSNLTVKADLSEIGRGVAEQLYDDGTHGDLVASDGIYSLNQIEAIEYTDPGNYTITITVNDGTISTTTSALLIVELATQVQISSILPPVGTGAGDQVVLLTASSTTVDFTKTLPQVTFIQGVTQKTVTILSAHSVNKIFVKTPTFSPGFVDVKIVSGGVTMTRKNGYLYVASSEVPYLKLSPLPLSVTEGKTDTMVIRTFAPVTKDLVVSLNNTDTSKLTLPNSVVIPSGFKQVAFSVSTKEDNDFDDNHVMVYASANSYLDSTGMVKIVDNDLPTITVTPNPLTLVEGTSSPMTVTLGRASLSNTTVTLTSANASKLTVSPATVTIIAGSTEGQFTIQAVDDSDQSNEVVTITATAGVAYASGTATINVADNDDTVAPYVASINPTNGTTGVNIDNNITVTFSESIDQSTINNSVELLSGTSVVSATMTYNSTNYSVTIDPTSALINGTTYTVKVKNTIKDGNGNPMFAEYQSSFTTVTTSSSSSSSRRKKRRSNRRTYYPTYTAYTGTNLTNTQTQSQYNPYNQYTPYNFNNTGVVQNNIQNYGSTSAVYKSGSRAEYIKNVLIQNNIQLTTGGKSSFRDVTYTNPYYDYIVTAEKLGLIKGFGNGTFRPNSMITPQEINVINAKLLRR